MPCVSVPKIRIYWSEEAHQMCVIRREVMMARMGEIEVGGNGGVCRRGEEESE